MSRVQIVLVAVIPTVLVAALLLAVVTWRERTAVAERRAHEETAQRQLDEMHRLGDQLTAVKADAKQWQDKWLEDTRRLNDDLAKANQALIDTAESQKKAEAAVAELAKQLADLNAQLKQLKDQAPQKPEKP